MKQKNSILFHCICFIQFISLCTNLSVYICIYIFIYVSICIIQEAKMRTENELLYYYIRCIMYLYIKCIYCYHLYCCWNLDVPDMHLHSIDLRIVAQLCFCYILELYKKNIYISTTEIYKCKKYMHAVVLISSFSARRPKIVFVNEHCIRIQEKWWQQLLKSS